MFRHIDTLSDGFPPRTRIQQCEKEVQRRRVRWADVMTKLGSIRAGVSWQGERPEFVESDETHRHQAWDSFRLSEGT